MSKESRLRIEKTIPMYLKIYELLKNEIVYGDIPPGNELVETRLANEMGVSRSPVRDALNLLVRDGLAVNMENCVIKVITTTIIDIAEIYITRAALEAQSAANASTNVDKEFTNELRAIVEKSEKANKEDDVKVIVDCNTHFHQMIINK